MPKLQCSVSGLWYAVTTNHKKELVEKFEKEGLDLENDYVSRDARRLIKDGKTVDEVRDMAASGEIETKTVAPKRALKSGSGAPAVVTPKLATKPDTSEVVTAPQSTIDPDIGGFMDGQVPEGSAASKAV